jgi:hypothetical protein
MTWAIQTDAVLLIAVGDDIMAKPLRESKQQFLPVVWKS